MANRWQTVPEWFARWRPGLWAPLDRHPQLTVRQYRAWRRGVLPEKQLEAAEDLWRKARARLLAGESDASVIRLFGIRPPGKGRAETYPPEVLMDYQDARRAGRSPAEARAEIVERYDWQSVDSCSQWLRRKRRAFEREVERRERHRIRVQEADPDPTPLLLSLDERVLRALIDDLTPIP